MGPEGPVAVLAFGLCLCYNILITIMYSTVVISILTATGEPRSVETISDLIRPEFRNLRWDEAQPIFRQCD